MWKLLWIPPSLPYYAPQGPYAEPQLANITKRLVFSCWRVVPKVISALLSYEAERNMARACDTTAENTKEARKIRPRLLVFSKSGDRLTGMPVLGMLYPCETLAKDYDPLLLQRQEEPLSTSREVIGKIRPSIQERIDKLRKGHMHGKTTGPSDESWYWAAPILLDLENSRRSTCEWFEQPNLAVDWAGEDANDAAEPDSLWSVHVAKAKDLLQKGTTDLGPVPQDLARVLSELAVAGPGVVAYRALSRMTTGIQRQVSVESRNHAGRIAHAFRHLFNIPETISLIRSLNKDEPYWHRVIEYCIHGNLQAVMDEYFHMLRESLGLLDASPEETTLAIADVASNAIALRTSTLGWDHIRTNGGVELDQSRRTRSRFAMRFGEQQDESTGINQADRTTRKEQVREAFNSPFWPFVLATTSVGQEGLDFHSYCHAVVHWNLPSNPVDLEQREGRVHRYKGHAIRKNVAIRNRPQLKPDGNDPWEQLFQLACGQHEGSDLTPYWVYPIENGAKIERYVPALPLSHDIQRYNALKKALVFYRMVFGQSRQEDLINYLLAHVPKEQAEDVIRSFCIDLTPPRRLPTTP